MLQVSRSRPLAAVVLAGALLLTAAPMAMAASGTVTVSGPRADDTMPGMDHGSMPGMDDGSMPGMDHGSVPGMDRPAASTAGEGHDAAAREPSERPRTLVLALFAGFNGAVMAAAAAVRRRTKGRRPGRRPDPRRAAASVA